MPGNIDRVDLGKSIKQRLKERYGRTLGKKLADCIKECIVREVGEIDKVKECIKTCLSKEIQDGDIELSNIDEVMVLLGHWHTVG